jgi:hypothetical protein
MLGEQRGSLTRMPIGEQRGSLSKRPSVVKIQTEVIIAPEPPLDPGSPMSSPKEDPAEGEATTSDGDDEEEVPLETPMTRRLSHASAESVKEIKFHQSGHS